MREVNVLKVAGKSSVSSVAGSIVKSIEDNKDVELHSIGASSVNQTVKAIATARGILATKGFDALLRVGFSSTRINEEDKTITYTDYENSKIITNFITVVVNSQKVALNKTSLEHLGLEIQLEGKKGIEHGYYVLNVPAAQVLSSPQYEFSEEKLQYGNELIFNIIDSKRNAPTLSFVSE